MHTPPCPLDNDVDHRTAQGTRSVSRGRPGWERSLRRMGARVCTAEPLCYNWLHSKIKSLKKQPTWMSCHPGSYEKIKTCVLEGTGGECCWEGAGSEVAPGPEDSAAQTSGEVRGPSERQAAPSPRQALGSSHRAAPQPGSAALPSAPHAPAQPAPRLPSPGGARAPPLVLTPARQPGEARGRPRSEPQPGRPGPSGCPQARSGRLCLHLQSRHSGHKPAGHPAPRPGHASSGIGRVRLFVPQGLWPSGSSVHRTLWARILGWVAAASSGGSPTQVSCVSCTDRQVPDTSGTGGSPLKSP